MSPVASPCAACGGPLRLFGPRDAYEYHRCDVCATLQLHPMPTPAELAAAYRNGYIGSGHSANLEDPERWKTAGGTYHDRIVRCLKDRGVSGPVVDFGSGWGTLLQKLAANGFDARGVEVSEVMIEHCRKKKLNVATGIAELGLDGRASAVVLCGVFEHLTGHERWLGEFHRLLKDGGLLVSLQPTAALFELLSGLVRLGDCRKTLWRFGTAFCPPWHTVLFSIQGMDTLLCRNGFERVDVRPAPQGRSGGWKTPVQIALEAVNRAGWRLAGIRWPLLTSHIFIYRKKPHAA